MSYNLEGSLLEVCDCDVLCPCWIGEDPDNGTCQSALAYQIDQGTIDGVDVSGLTCAIAAFIPGNVLAGNFRVVRYVDDRASAEQEAALLAAFRGEKGGPLADLAQLVGEEVAARRAPITFTVDARQGHAPHRRSGPRRHGTLSGPERSSRPSWSRASSPPSPAHPPMSARPAASRWFSRRSGSISSSPATTRSRASSACEG